MNIFLSVQSSLSQFNKFTLGTHKGMVLYYVCKQTDFFWVIDFYSTAGVSVDGVCLPLTKTSNRCFPCLCALSYMLSRSHSSGDAVCTLNMCMYCVYVY